MMKNYIRQVIELFSQNDYPVSVQKQFRHWLADEEHKEEWKRSLLFGKKPDSSEFLRECSSLYAVCNKI